MFAEADRVSGQAATPLSFALRDVFVIGEALDFGADGAVISSATTIGCARLVNLYGITETTVRGVDHVRGWMTVRARRCDSVW